MAKNPDRIPIRDTLRLHWRSIQLIHAHNPGLFAALFWKSASRAVAPYASIYFSAQLINELAGLRRPDMLWQWVILTLVSAALLALFCAATSRWAWVKFQLYSRTWDHVFAEKLFSMDFCDVDKQSTQDQRSQIKQNENWSMWGIKRVPYIVEDFIKGGIGILSGAVLSLRLFTSRVSAQTGALVFLNHPLVTLALLAIIVLVMISIPLFSNISSNAWSDLAQEGRFWNCLQDTFGSMGTKPHLAADIRMYAQQKFAIHYLEQNNFYGPKSPLAKQDFSPIGLADAVSRSLSPFLTGIIYVYVGLKALGGAFGIGSVTQYVRALTTLTDNFSSLFQLINETRSLAPYLKIAFDFLDIPNTMYQGTLPTEKRNDREYEVEFRDVSFRYPGSDLWALRHVSIKFKIGRRLAIVGENGSGKTTFIKLLCRLYDPTEGEIRLNGIDIRKYDYRDYMDVFAVVFQDFQLLSQPMGANVAGSDEYDRERVVQALTDAGFADRLDTLPDGLDTQLYRDFGENGVEVSGGEAQKIAIARALYKDAPFIILDEPTAALDPMAEAEIYGRFNDIAGDKTAIYISHRLSSCKFCDEIAVFHEGAVIQQGTHEALLADETGKYHELWNAQAQYYVSEQK